ncbi:hypothetical protein ABTX81_28390 [Kitasatospora sp. NPDC097605]|uniref:hypothetical protein n=1 Tax=Kitasatospora sp. NPDC097605 TaxID=3157226 RepID=UPI00332E6235
MSGYVNPPTEQRMTVGVTGRRATGWTFGTGCAAVLAATWSLGTVLVVPWHPGPRWEVLTALAVTVSLGLLWLLASRLAPEAERTGPLPPQPPPSPAALREVTVRAARRSKWSVLAGWAMVLPALWVAPVVFLTAHQPLERELIDRHAALVAAGARWTDCTVALSAYEAAGRPRPHGSGLAVHPAGHPEMSLALADERGKLDRFAAGDTLRVLLDIERPGLGTFPEPYLPLVHPGRPVAHTGFPIVTGVMVLIWLCVLIRVHGRRALLPTKWLEATDRHTAHPADAPQPTGWRRVSVHGTVLSWSFRTSSDEDSGTTWRSGIRLDPEPADASPGPGPVAFQEYADRFADADAAGPMAVRLAGATGWLGRQAGDRRGTLAVLVLDDGETRWGSEHVMAEASDDPATDPPTDTPVAADRRLHLPPPVQVFDPGQRFVLSGLVLWPMFVIWLNTVNAHRRFDGVGVFAAEVVAAAVFTAAVFGVRTLRERRRLRRQTSTDA